MSIAKKIILEELEENNHPEHVENVIFWALEYYCKHRKKKTWGELIAYAIKERIIEAEKLDREKEKYSILPKQDINKN